MATYNGAKYIREQIDSILIQTIQDFELVVCDDCSKDNTLLILREYAEKDHRIRVYENDKNLGFKKNFEKAISLCNGEFIALCDQDDIWLPEHLNLLHKNMIDNVQVVCGDALLIDENGKSLNMTLSYIDSMDYVPVNNLDIARHILLGKGTFQGASMLIRKSLIKYALPIPQETTFHDVWLSALACFTGGLSYINQPVLKYRRHNEEITAGKRRLSFMRLLIGATLVNHSLKDRIPVIDAIVNRVDNLSAEQLDFLKLSKKMLKRRNNIWGRIANVPYLLQYRHSIYTVDKTI